MPEPSEPVGAGAYWKTLFPLTESVTADEHAEVRRTLNINLSERDVLSIPVIESKWIPKGQVIMCYSPYIQVLVGTFEPPVPPIPPTHLRRLWHKLGAVWSRWMAWTCDN